MKKPNYCKECPRKIECEKSYKRYITEGTKHLCFYENPAETKGGAK